MEKITSRKNPLAIHFKRLGADRGYREGCGEFLCDGIKLFEDAVNSGAALPAVLTAVPIPFPLSPYTKVYYTDRGLINSLSPLKNAQDILFTCKMRERDRDQGLWEFGIRNSEFGMKETGEAQAAREMCYNGGLHILLDRVQDPGNVGAIIRTANAFDIKSVILYGGCADAYNHKTVRATMGAIFRQYICKMGFPELRGLKDSGARFIGTALRKDCRAIFDVKLENAVVAIGSEGAGLSEEILSLCDDLITIPIAGGCESLNASVAAAIIMWEARRNRTIEN